MQSTVCGLTKPPAAGLAHHQQPGPPANPATTTTMSRRRLLLFTDFDETLTSTDTLSHLVATAYTLQGPDVLLPPWDYFSSTYLCDYDTYAKQFPAESRRTLEEEQRFLEGLRGAERASVERVEEAGVFRGLDRGVLVRDAARMGGMMREGWEEVVRGVVGERGWVVVVSVNWSRAWIRECLVGVEEEEVRVFANEFVVGEDGRTSGRLDRWFGEVEGGIWTAGDKVKVMRDFIGGGEQKEALVVYVGDSVTDLLCLLEADVGVVFGRKLDGVCERLGVPIRDGLVAGDTPRGGLSRIGHWRELKEWIDTV